MNLKINYFDNQIRLNKENIQVIEIENKKTFYRLVNDLYSIKNNEKLNEIYFFDDNNQEINMYDKVELYINFFDLELNSKKNLNMLNKNIVNNINDQEKNEILNNFKKLYKSFNKILFNIDIPIILNNDITIEDIVKFFKISINKHNDLLDNLLLLIDLEKTLKINEILFFINLKQYLNKNELIELYKYLLYNNIVVLLIDSQSYGICNEYEKKIIIDEELEEYKI